MPILKRFEKQPGDTQDYDIHFGEWLAEFGDNDSPTSHTVKTDPGVTVLSAPRNGSTVKVWLSGGQHGRNYKVTTTLFTLGGRIKEAEIQIKVKEY